MINKHINHYFANNKTKTPSEEIKIDISEFYQSICEQLLNFIKEIDIEKYAEIATEYKEFIKISKYDYDKDFCEIVNKYFPTIIKELGNYFVTKMNNKVDGEKIINAAMLINKDIFNLNEEQEEEFKNHLIEVNKNRQELYFPKREIKNIRTGEIVYENDKNKFDIENNEQKSGKTKKK